MTEGYVFEKDHRTRDFTLAEFANVWASHRGEVFGVHDDLRPFHREFHDAMSRLVAPTPRPALPTREALARTILVAIDGPFMARKLEERAGSRWVFTLDAADEVLALLIGETK